MFPEYYAQYMQKYGSGTGPTSSNVMVCIGPVRYRGHDAVQRDIARLKAAIGEHDGRRGLPPGRLPDGLRAQRVLRHRGRVHGRGGRGAARGVPGHRRLRADPAGRRPVAHRAAHGGPVRAAGAAPRRGRRARRAHQPRAARHPARAGPAAHVLRAQPRAAPARRGLRRRGRLHARDQRGRLLLRGRQPAPPARVAHLGDHEPCPTARSSCPGSCATPTTSSSTRASSPTGSSPTPALVGRENVIASADCGFSSRAIYTPEVHPTVAWAKLEALAEGARLATEQLW